MKQTEYVIQVNRPVSQEQAVRLIEALIAVDDSEPIPVPGSGGVAENGIEYSNIALGSKFAVKAVD